MSGMPQVPFKGYIGYIGIMEKKMEALGPFSVESLKAKPLEQRVFIFGCVSACPVLLEVLAWPSTLLESHLFFGQGGGC